MCYVERQDWTIHVVRQGGERSREKEGGDRMDWHNETTGSFGADRVGREKLGTAGARETSRHRECEWLYSTSTVLYPTVDVRFYLGHGDVDFNIL